MMVSFKIHGWVALGLVAMAATGQEAIITVEANQVQHRVSRYLAGACLEDVNHEVYGGIDSQMIYGESFAEPEPGSAPNNPQEPINAGVSARWLPLRRGTAHGEFSLEDQNPFVGRQSQRISFITGIGEIGLANSGLNHWGMNFVKGKVYEGYVWARSTAPRKVFVSLESGGGSTILAEKALRLKPANWQRLDFTLTPSAADKGGRFVIKLKSSGSVVIGYAFLQPGAWGRYKGLPVRKDIAEALIDQGVTVLRFGGCMANAAEYRWKKMIGPRAQRPPYAGWWHPQSSNGWGIFDFLNFCEAAGFLAVPDVNASETPQDLADLIEYANGAADMGWGRQRARDGHPKPYHLKYLEIGNEEKVNDEYWRKFKPSAEAVWAKDPGIILVVGDFCYHQPITDPFKFNGADGGITTLATQQKILLLAKQHEREVWFDVHAGTEGPRPDFGGTLSYIDALGKIADGAKHRVVIFEFNAGNHAQRRALANAAAINLIERDGRVPLACSANCLQPDGQNDNGWDQGLLFLNPSQVWLQPPGYVTKMFSNNYEPLLVKTETHCPNGALDVNAKRGEGGNTLVLQVVNFTERSISSAIRLNAYSPSKPTGQVQELAAPLDAVNTAGAPTRIKPTCFAWTHGMQNDRTSFTFPPYSFTVIRLE